MKYQCCTILSGARGSSGLRDGVQSGGTGIGECRQAMIMKRPQHIQTYSSQVYFSAGHLDHSRFRHTAVRFISQQTVFQHTHNGLTLTYKQCSMGHKENTLLLNSNCFSEQQDGRHLCVASTVLFAPRHFRGCRQHYWTAVQS